MASTLPPQIEIFKPGRHTDDSGTVHHFSSNDVAGMQASYDPTLREAPLCVGHPAHNLPAYGWVKALHVSPTGHLTMDAHEVQPQFAEMVEQKLFKKRSASFYPPSHSNNPCPGRWYLRHVAFLGAQPPAIAGLADFADGITGCINFSEDTPPASAAGPLSPNETSFNPEQLRMTQELKDQLATAQAQNAALQASAAQAAADAAAAKAQLAQFAQAARTERTAAFTSYAEAQVQAALLKPAEKSTAVELLNLAADAKPASFAEGQARPLSALEFVKSLIERAKPVVSFGEHAAGHLPQRGTAQGLSDAEIDAQAQAWSRQHKVSYAEALSAVCSFTA